MAPLSIPRLEPVYRPRTKWMKGRPCPFEEGSQYTVKIYVVNLSSSLPQRDLWVFIMVTVQWGKGNNTNLSGTTELTLISRNPKHHWGLPVRVGGLWRSHDQWNFSSGPSHSGASGSSDPYCGYFLSFEMHNWNRLSYLQNSHIVSLSYGRRAFMMEKTKWKSLEQPSPRKIVKTKEIPHSRRGCRD